MSEAGNIRQIDDPHDLLELVELTDVRFYESAAKRRLDGSERGDDTFRVAVRHDDQELEIRCRTRIESDAATFIADAGAVYQLTEPVEISPQALETFVGRVGVMAVYPFLREAVSQGAARLTVARPLLPMLVGGNVPLERDESSHIEDD
ncbi:hypothetical protein [Gordonia aquimaris]|uniref:Preprotein translocase subunit SecB n=1 Tax=Gordonia aquimaris TaxID=2984863 RepID=A0A9X3D8E6_9ACTN|nr:hypothetical protein [Gordonia aquimaris]MCX2965611.1 hypothetical protein [Gordonia aquimaris]